MIGTIRHVTDVQILANGREIIMTDKGLGMIGMSPNLLPVVTLNDKAVEFTREELIELAYSKLTE